MLTAGKFTRFTARLLSLNLIAATLITVGASFAPVSRTAVACPAPPPQPLRVLYLQSPQIVIARLGKTEAIKPADAEAAENQDSEATQLRTALLVSSTLKGETKPVVYVNHYTYGDYKDGLSSEEEGQTLLVFLRPQDEGEDFYVDDMSFGVKKLSDADLKVYVQRIEELASIMKAEKPGETEIVEWLVRCAEEPATQWEGAYELMSSSYMVDYEQEQANAANPEAVTEEAVTEEPVVAEAEAEVATAEPAEEQAAEATETESTASIQEVEAQDYEFQNEYPTKSDYFKLLTAEQKYRLTTALVNLETLGDAHYYLIELTQKWDDARVVPYLLSQLRNSKDESPYLTDNLTMIVAKRIGDKALIALAEKFAAGEEEAAAETEVQADAESSDASEENINAEATLSEAEQEQAANAATTQKRLARLQYFITLAESTVPQPAAEQAVNVSVSAP